MKILKLLKKFIKENEIDENHFLLSPQWSYSYLESTKISRKKFNRLPSGAYGRK